MPEGWRVQTHVKGVGGVGDTRPHLDRPEAAPTLTIDRDRALRRDRDHPVRDRGRGTLDRRGRQSERARSPASGDRGREGPRPGGRTSQLQGTHRSPRRRNRPRESRLSRPGAARAAPDPSEETPGRYPVGSRPGRCPRRSDPWTNQDPPVGRAGPCSSWSVEATTEFEPVNRGSCSGRAERPAAASGLAASIKGHGTTSKAARGTSALGVPIHAHTGRLLVASGGRGG